MKVKSAKNFFFETTNANLREAKTIFEAHIDQEEAMTKIPMVYDYFKVYLAFLENTSGCEGIAQKYLDSP